MRDLVSMPPFLISSTEASLLHALAVCSAKYRAAHNICDYALQRGSQACTGRMMLTLASVSGDIGAKMTGRQLQGATAKGKTRLMHARHSAQVWERLAVRLRQIWKGTDEGAC